MVKVLRYLYIAIVFMVNLAAFGTDIPNAMKARDYTLSIDVSTEPYGAAITNEIVGATEFYNAGVYGQGASVANVELGVYWPNHDFLKSATLGEVFVPTGIEASAIYDSHATGTAAIIGGYNAEAETEIENLFAFGIAPLATLSAGGVARQINDDGTASVETADFCAAYKNFFRINRQDAISSSWGPESVAPDNYFAKYVDALSYENRFVNLVIATGNSGEKGINTVSGFAQAYNAIAVGALGNSYIYDEISSYSSRSPSDFYNPITNEIVECVRAAVDITAPGDNIAVAYYDKTDPSKINYYSISSGTSFATPIVSGVVALLKSTSYTLEANPDFVQAGWTENARDSRVIKAVLLNSANKPNGWNNGQSFQNGVEFKVEIGSGIYYTTSYDNIILTTQGLDYTYGAGILAADKALLQYVGMYTDGNARNVWIFDTVDFDSSKLYHIGEYRVDDIITLTLAWMVESELTFVEGRDYEDVTNLAFSNLRLELWIKEGETFTPVAVSDSAYNNVEHLSVTLAALADYYVRVAFFDMAYGEKENETYALAWSVAVPEPALFAAMLAVLALFVSVRRRFS